MKLTIKFISAILIASAFFLLTGCDLENKKKEPPKPSTIVPEDLWGQWLSVTTGSVYNLNSKTATSYNRVDKNLIYDTDSTGIRRYLIRSGNRLTRVNGTVRLKDSLYSQTKGITDIGNFEAIIEHRKDRSIREKTYANPQGNFDFYKVPSGEYDIIVTDKKDKTTMVLPEVNVSGNRTDVGTIVLNKSSENFNLKTSWSTKEKFLFMGRTYNGSLSVENLGTQIASGLTYKITCDDPLVEQIVFNDENAAGSIDGKSRKTIPLTITSGSRSNPLGRENVTLKITVTDVYGYQWKESVDITLYERPLSLNISCNKSYIQGHLIIPGHDLIRIYTSNTSIEIPYMPDDSFYLALACTKTSDETAYSIGFDKEVAKTTDFTDTSSYEPNNNEAEAVAVGLNSTLSSYIHAGDIDFYKLDSGYLPELTITGPDYAMVNTPVSFNMTANDEDSSITNMFIDFGDGSDVFQVSNTTTYHSYDLPGTFIVTFWTYDSITGKMVDTKTLINVSSDGDITFENGMAFNKIEAGSFLMGSPADETGRNSSEVQHTVHLTKGFYMMTTEVTQAQWKNVMGSLPKSIKTECLSCPVVYVSWNDVMNFIEVMKVKYGENFDLPTEAEWEYAARSDTQTAFYTGGITNRTTDANLDSAGWYYSNSGNTTHEVARKKANTWGLYDMHGNVHEWCLDGSRVYTAVDIVDPVGPADSKNKAARGGSYSDDAYNCRAARRYNPDNSVSNSTIGFRLIIRP